MKIYSREEKQSLRLKRLNMSMSSWILFFALVGLAQRTGLVSLNNAEYWLCVGLSSFVQVLFFIAIRTGFNLRFKDPSLTVPQMVNALLWVTFLLSHTQQIRGLAFLIYFVILLFGVFKLDRKGYFLISLVPALGYAGVIFWDTYREPEGFDLTLNIVQWFFMVGVLVWLSNIGSYISFLQKKLHARGQEILQSHKEISAQRDELETAHRELEVAHRELEEAMEKLGELAKRDELTGLFNRRQLMKILDTRLAEQSRASFALCIIDLDHFKNINDTYGHLAGDEALKTFAQISQKCLRESDIIARFGGEEFVIYLPRGNQETAMSCAERVRTRFAGHVHDNIEPGLTMTLSAGVTLHRDRESVDTTLDRADQALYQAKNEGRNRVIFA